MVEDNPIRYIRLRFEVTQKSRSSKALMATQGTDTERTSDSERERPGVRPLAVLRSVGAAFVVATIVYAIRTKQAEGRFLLVPYDFRVPTLQRIRDSLWNPDDPRLFAPRAFGIGWSVNLYRVLRYLRGDGEESPTE